MENLIFKDVRQTPLDMPSGSDLSDEDVQILRYLPPVDVPTMFDVMIHQQLLAARGTYSHM